MNTLNLKSVFEVDHRSQDAEILSRRVIKDSLGGQTLQVLKTSGHGHFYCRNENGRIERICIFKARYSIVMKETGKPCPIFGDD